MSQWSSARRDLDEDEARKERAEAEAYDPELQVWELLRGMGPGVRRTALAEKSMMGAGRKEGNGSIPRALFLMLCLCRRKRGSGK